MHAWREPGIFPDAIAGVHDGDLRYHRVMNRLPAWLIDALWSLGYATVFYAAFQTAHLFWYLPAGVRFGALLVSPYRRWPWLIAVEAALLGVILYDNFTAVHGVLAIAALVSNPLLAALGPWWLRTTQWRARPASPGFMVRLLCALTLAAMGGLLGNLFYPFAEAEHTSTTLMVLQIVLGDYIGMLSLVPLIVMAAWLRPAAELRRRWRVDVPGALAPTLAVYLLLATHFTDVQTFFLSSILAFVPSLYFAVRSGWRGAAIAISTATMAMAWSGVMTGDPTVALEAQGLLAVAGSVCLLLGASQDALHASALALSARNAQLAHARSRQTQLGEALRHAARRNLDLSEQVRRWITAELHDEIGQNLTAMQTRLRLLERKAKLQGDELFGEINAILLRMRQSVSGLLSSLRPVGLDELGLGFALRDGAIRRFVEAAGIGYATVIEDPRGTLEALDDDTRTMLYRIVQEAATNTVRHAHATCLRVRLRIASDHLLLVIVDDGRGFDPVPDKAGIGLQGTGDRVLALGGRLRLRSGGFGTRLSARIRFAPDTSGN